MTASELPAEGDSPVPARRTALVIALLLATLVAASTVRGRETLDRSFGRDGRILLSHGNTGQGVADVAIDRDGRIVLAGLEETDGDAVFAVARLLGSGGRDRSFGQKGVVKTDFRRDTPNDPVSDIPFAVAVQPDRKIVVAGQTQDPSEDSSVALARYMPGGALDDSFGDGGRVITDLTCNSDVCSLHHAEDVVIQPDGRIVVTGIGYVGPTPSVGVMRYMPDGRLDGSFGQGGFTATELVYGNASAYAVALHKGGLVVAATTSSEFVALRYNMDGSLDRSFGTDGAIYVGVGPPGYYQAPQGIAVDRSDRIVLGGFIQTGSVPDTFEYVAVRLRPDGRPDETFSGDGIAFAEPSKDIFARDQAHDVAVQRDGKVIVVGVAARTRLEFGVVRFTERGRLDRTFGRKGKVKIDFGDQRGDWAQAVALDGKGRIVVAGGSAMPTGGAPFYEWAVTRLRT
jgi:uncharacterized delta-60 repeat protein